MSAIDVESDLRFAQLELEQAQREADEQMLKFVASQKAFQEEMERETQLHHAHISERIKKRHARRAALKAGKEREENPNRQTKPSGEVIKQMKTIIGKASQSNLTEEGVNHLIKQLVALSEHQKSVDESREALGTKSD